MSLHIHTRRVYFLRFFLPALAICGLVVVTMWPALKEFRENHLAKLSANGLRVQSIALTMTAAGQPAQLQVTKPEFTGRDEQNRPYRITAERVLQGLSATSAMTLEKPVARLILRTQDGQSAEEATLQGDTGVYDPQKKNLTLNGHVVLTQSGGYTLNMDDLFIDLLAGISKTQTPVTGVGPMGQLTGQSLELRDKGDHIILHGKSKVILTPQKAG